MTFSHAQHDNRDTDNLRFAFWLNLGFALLEVVGGLLTNSIAIVSDALHDLGDSLALGVAWFLGRYSQKDSDKRYSYGYRRFSLLGALINAIVLTSGSIFILIEAVPRLFNPQTTYAPGMIGLALVGVVVNSVAAWRLHGGGSMNAEVIGWHLMEDVLGWVAVLVVGVVLLFTDWHFLDPLLSVGITLYILYGVVGSLRDTVRLFLQAVPEGVRLADVDTALCDITGVERTHHVHVWSLDGEKSVITAHLVVGADVSREACQRIKQEARAAVQHLQPEHVTFEIVYADEDFAVAEPADANQSDNAPAQS